MFIIVSVDYYNGPSCTAPKLHTVVGVGEWYHASRAYAALRRGVDGVSKPLRLAHNQYNRTYYVISRKHLPDADVTAMTAAQLIERSARFTKVFGTT